MTYDKTKHLLRPLEDGDKLEFNDIVCNQGGIQLTKFAGQRVLNANGNTYFRLVPIPQWHPRSEAGLIQEVPKGALIAFYYENGSITTWHWPHKPHSAAPWTHFFIIPPCDLSAPDPERVAFEDIVRDLAPAFSVIIDFSLTSEGKYKNARLQESFENWKAAARKESK